jgi:hypothetical protein
MVCVYLQIGLTRSSCRKEHVMGKASGQLLRVRQVIQVAEERRDSKRAPCRLVCLFKLTKFVDKSTVKLTKGFGHVINKSVRGMLLLLPVPLNKRQVVEIQVSSEARKTPRTKLVEVCWARPIPVSTRVKMYLAGTRFFFELPASRQLPQAR